MKILVTGAKGFIGKNLVSELRNRKSGHIYEFDSDNSLSELEMFTKDCDIVFHLAGVNRPLNVEEFKEGNSGFTNTLISLLKKNKNTSALIFSSSTQVTLDNPYGRSKLEAETSLMHYSKESGIPVAIFRLPNVFGKWCRPSYNSVVATFCHNIAHELPLQVNDPEANLNLVYIDDVVNELISESHSIVGGARLIEDLQPVYRIKLGVLASIIQSFRENRIDLQVPDLSDAFTAKLYATYLSYLPANEFSYPLKMNKDQRGSFTEFIKSPDRGQVSVNVSLPGIVKGNHWHHTKNEKFLVVSGSGVIRFRKIGTSEILEYFVSGDKLEVVDIPTGYTHNIENLGKSEMVTVMWASEAYDPKRPDTFSEIV